MSPGIRTEPVLAAIAEGPSEIHFFSPSADCRSTLVCLDLKAVNPNAKSNEDKRTPEELIDLVEAKGKEVA